MKIFRGRGRTLHFWFYVPTLYRMDDLDDSDWHNLLKKKSVANKTHAAKSHSSTVETWVEGASFRI